MLQRRNWLLRLSLALNTVVFLYFGALNYQTLRGEPYEEVQANRLAQESSEGEPSRRILLDIGSQPPSFLNTQTQSFPYGQSLANRTSRVTTEHSTTETVPQATISCYDKKATRRIAQRSGFWVLYNYVLPSRSFRCWESITYTTHGDFTFLDNLEPLLERWKGPISVALFAPGTDFNITLWSIRYLRDCSSQPISEYVTFHIYFPFKHMPKIVHGEDEMLARRHNCTLPPPWVNTTTYKAQKDIVYPINVGRNVARESATTHYVLASDIELYPSPGVIPYFLEMVGRLEPNLTKGNPKIFPLPIFELQANVTLPADKTELVSMLKNNTAITFHKNVCTGCHRVPKEKEWIASKNSSHGLSVFYVGKRTGRFSRWEPIYIGTNEDPVYDERLSWEGKSDKMTQGYILCALNYEFHILDNAFLVHKPGIKLYKKDPARSKHQSLTNSQIRTAIYPELKLLYGAKQGCAV